MNNIYHAARIDPDYDQLNNIVMVAEDELKATELFVNEYGYERHSFIEKFTIEKIGITDKPCGTLILRDY